MYETSKIFLSYKQIKSFDERKFLSDKILNKHSDKIPVIVEPYRSCDPQIKRNKFLVHTDITMKNFIKEIIKYIEPNNGNKIFTFYVNNKQIYPKTFFDNIYAWYKYGLSYISAFTNLTVISLDEMAFRLYYNYKDEDGFLYIIYAT